MKPFSNINKDLNECINKLDGWNDSLSKFNKAEILIKNKKQIKEALEGNGKKYAVSPGNLTTLVYFGKVVGLSSSTMSRISLILEKGESNILQDLRDGKITVLEAVRSLGGKPKTSPQPKVPEYEFVDKYSPTIMAGLSVRDQGKVWEEIMARELGINVNVSMLYQVKEGENALGIEFKYNSKLQELSSLWILTARQRGDGYVVAGCCDPRNVLYIVGDLKEYFVFYPRDLQKYFINYQVKEQTFNEGKGFVISKEQAKVLCVKHNKMQFKIERNK